MGILRAAFIAALFFFGAARCAYLPAIAGGGAAGIACGPGVVQTVRDGIHDGGDKWSEAVKDIFAIASCGIHIEEAVRQELAAHGCTNVDTCGATASAGAVLPGLVVELDQAERERIVYAQHCAQRLRARTVTR